mmetsp:Transcript_33169/g.67878  ORF Transcript_33169/g.67878 Transcript_33169/m.67878 type:complete len:224 (-) Transcript_33169:1551-2222(-)
MSLRRPQRLLLGQPEARLLGQGRLDGQELLLQTLLFSVARLTLHHGLGCADAMIQAVEDPWHLRHGPALHLRLFLPVLRRALPRGAERQKLQHTQGLRDLLALQHANTIEIHLDAKLTVDGIRDLLKACQTIFPGIRPSFLQLGWKSCGLFQSHGHIQQKLRGRPCQKLGRGFLGFANDSFYSDQLTQNCLSGFGRILHFLWRILSQRFLWHALRHRENGRGD